MGNSFTIQFDYPMEETEMVFSLLATATLHNSDPYYIVNGFRVAGRKNAADDVLPEVKIRSIKKNGETIWVHCDSGRPTALSILLGKEIEAHIRSNPSDN